MQGWLSRLGAGGQNPPNSRGDAQGNRSTSAEHGSNASIDGNALRDDGMGRGDAPQSRTRGPGSHSRGAGSDRSGDGFSSATSDRFMRTPAPERHESRPVRSIGDRRKSHMPTLFGLGRQGAADSDMERRVSTAAANLCAGVQRVVQDAKTKSRPDQSSGAGPDEWKTKLLKLLGGNDQDIEERMRRGKTITTDLDELLECSSCEKFVLRCVENELAPNLIHCLRLLRLSELQNAHRRGKNSDQPISTTATAKVSRLLCLLCIDPIVGEQLRPHLHGLLGLSGASYPPSGVHIAEAANAVIIAFCNSCLSNSLVWFLHDRQMITRMTDDMRELCGMTAISGSSVTKCLHGKDAEKAGLWVIALKTLVSLVTYSCEYDCAELIRDFDTAGGYHVLSYAIANSDESNVKKLLELVTMLVCCKIDDDEDAKDSESKNDSTDRGVMRIIDDSKLATNVAAFEIMEDLMISSIPFLDVYQRTHDGKRPSMNVDDLRELAEFSVKTAVDVIGTNEGKPPAGIDLAYEILVTTLQLYSDHADNISIIESKYSILSYYLLSFPTFSDLTIKVSMLKMLEYICTTGIKDVIPISVASEIFLSLCQYLLNESSSHESVVFSLLLTDTELLCATLEKLVQMDESAPKIMQDVGLLDDQVNQMLPLVTAAKSEDDSPPRITGMDGPFSAICRILRTVACCDDTSLPALPGHGSGSVTLNTLLTNAVKNLGDGASREALSVFEAIMSQMHMRDKLTDYLNCLIGMLHHFADNVEIKLGQNIDGEVVDGVDSNLDDNALRRELQILNVIKGVIDTNDLAQDLFLHTGGYEVLLRLLWSCEGCIKDSAEITKDKLPDGVRKDKKFAVLKLVESSFGILVSSSSSSMTEKTSALSLPSSALDGDAAGMGNNTVVALSMQGRLPELNPNRSFLLRSGFYIEFSSAIAHTGLLNVQGCVFQVLNWSLSTMEPTLKLPPLPSAGGSNGPAPPPPSKISYIINTDAALLVLGVATRLNTPLGDLAKRALDEILRLCAPSNLASTLSQMAMSGGLTKSLTSRTEFGPQVEDRSYPLYSRFVLLLRRVTACYMSYVDFVSLLRCIARPILQSEADYIKQTKNKFKKIQGGGVVLPVISSFIKTDNVGSSPISKDVLDARKMRDTDICARLETLAIIAAKGVRVSRCIMGGGVSLSNIALHKDSGDAPLDERLFYMADNTDLKFIHISNIDSGAVLHAAGGDSKETVTEKVWPPFVSCGFSYSLWLRLPMDGELHNGHLFLLDINTKNQSHTEFFSLWYDLATQQFHLLSSSTSRLEPVRFPRSPLQPGVWHHLLLTYVPPKRPMLSRKANAALFIDGRPLESDIKVENVNLPPSAQAYIGVPNPVLASGGQVANSLVSWELGPTIFLSTVLGRDKATAMFSAGPDFEGLFWGDRPQRLSLTATATATFAMLAESGEKGSVAGALRRRNVPEVEAAGHVTREKGSQEDTLLSVGLLCHLTAEDVVFGFRAGACVSCGEDGRKTKLINIARIDSAESIASDAVVYGKESVITPNSFADNIQWVGGPTVLMPLVNAVQTASSLAITLRLIHNSVKRHPPNLENLQGGGGYRILGLLLRQKQIMDSNVMDQCFAFAVHGFEPGSDFRSGSVTDHWVLTDLDAMKYLLLNHQVWDMRRNGPDLPLRVLQFLNNLVAANSVHAAFNSRRLHLLGIVRWTLHLMLEAAELYDAQYDCDADLMYYNSVGPNSRPSKSAAGGSTAWKATAPSVAGTAVGGDPGNPLLRGCKSLLRRVLTYMLTPDDLEALAGVIIYTLSITGGMEKNTGVPGALPMPPPPMGVSAHHPRAAVPDQDEEKLAPGPVARIYLLRLLEELVVDGVNEIVSANSAEQKPQTSSDDPQQADTATVMQPHAGGGTSANQYYFATSILAKKGPKCSSGSVGASGVERLSAAASGGSVSDASSQHPKHQQAQAFLSAFAGILTPVWFACVLEGSREEASAAAALRLMMLMLQSSPTFSGAFEMAGGFSPLVLSIPKFSTCPAIILSMLSQLLHAPILHLPCFATLDATQLCEVFDLESDATELIINDSTQGGLHTPSDPSCGIFALLAECLGRNIQLASYQNEAGFKARHTNEAVIRLLGHRHTFSSSFQEFCRTPDFLEPLAQALCLVHDQKMKGMITMSQPPQDPFGTSQRRGGFGDAADDTDFLPWGNTAGPNVGHPHGRDPRTTRSSTQRRGSLCTVNRDETPTERLVGKGSSNVVTSGIGMVELLHLVLSHAVLSGPTAGTLLAALFRSFPIHASLEQVEAFHLVLIEHCRNVVEDALQRGEPIALANCIGVGSVLLDRLMAGFFTSEPVLETVNIVLATLRSLTATGTYASRTLANADQTMLVADTAHFARLTCLTALHRSRPSGPYDDGDDDLKLAVLEAIAKNLRQLLLIPGTTGGATTVAERGTAERGKSARQQNAGAFIPPQPNNRFYPLYQSASLSRCSPPGVTAIYPELFQVDQPDRAFVIALMSQIYNLLLDRRRDIREQAVVILISLLHQRRAFMQELLVTEIPRGENRMETVDLMNRGGFGALFIEESAMRDDSSQYTMPSRLSEMGGSGLGTGKLKYQSFFEWFNRNQPQIAAVFHGIHIHALRLLPGISAGASTPEEAIENEQKVMLLKLTSQDSSDRTIQGGIKRAELAENLHEKTGENHALWKRQGFDDLSSGAMLWKLLLRQLKGSHSIWEGGQNQKASEETDSGIFSRKQLVDKPEVGDSTAVDTTGDKKITPGDSKMRWKLDLTEGYERQRRRLLPNHEFQTLYKLDKLEKMEETAADSKTVTTDPTGISSDATADPSAMDEEGVRNEERWKHLQNSWRRGGMTGAVDALETTEITAAIVREMQMKVGAKDRDFFNDEDDDNEDQNEDMEDGMSQDDEFDNPNRDEYGDDMEMVNGDNERKSGDGVGVKANDLEGDDIGDDKDDDEKSDDEDDERDNSLASSYDLITGLLEPGDWPEKSYNVRRCAGLEVRRALLLWCREAIYIVDGFEQTEGDGLEGKINRLQMSTNTYDINLREEGTGGQGDASMPGRGNYSSAGMDRRGAANSQHDAEKAEGPQIAGDEITYQHRSQRIAFSDIYSVYRRRYQLQQIALEFYDVNRYGTFVSFSSEEEREEVLFKVLNSPLPNSIFSSMSGSVTINYNKFMNSLRAKITNQWVNGRMTNFEYIMHLNSFAGRTYNDLTQYPVFPWILSDYESEELDLDDPATYRDLSKPMGAQTEMRAAQYRERFEVLESSAQMNPDEPPPFHYGTHYSCAAYVLYYLMRLEPFSRMALSLQGGHFDHADRLFHNIGSSWKSASAENLQDVRELIPEFFYLGEFLVNSDNFDFGTTQGGKVVHDVTLPAWAKGDPARFIRMNRQALESDYVSRNLHHWLDLIFGYKQKGREADKALNKFVHLTYEGNVDLNEITDPIQREATIAQIHNFGQTPSKLERKPFPQRNIFNVAKEKNIDFSALFFLAALTPPFCVVGAPHRVYLRVSSIDTCRVGMTGQPDSSVGDMYWFKGQLVGVGRTCALILPSKKYYRFGGANNGVSVHVAIASARHREVNKVLSIHDGMHRSPISIAKPSLNGEWLVTGCIDSTVRVWRYNGKNVSLKASLCGHEGGKITCIDVSTTFGNVVTGGEDGNVLVWDLRRLTFLRQLKHKPEKKESKGYDGVENGVISVSINHKNGNILTLIGLTLSLFDINGTLLATQDTSAYKNYNRPSCAIATSCPEWMENGVVGVTGHVNGDVRLWSMNYDTCYLVMRHLVPDKVHTCPITSLRVYGEMQDTLLVGDRSGKMSVCKTLRLDGLNQQELNIILKEIQSGAAISDSDDGRQFSNYEGD